MYSGINNYGSGSPCQQNGPYRNPLPYPPTKEDY